MFDSGKNFLMSVGIISLIRAVLLYYFTAVDNWFIGILCSLTLVILVLTWIVKPLIGGSDDDGTDALTGYDYDGDGFGE